jgi:hypothetical protein
MLSLVLLLGLFPGVSARQENRFVLVAESGGTLVIAPEYVSYAEGDTLRQALLKTNHEFVGLEDGWIMEIDGVGGNYSRSDQNGGYDLNTPASEITHFRFSEDLDSKPSTGLMTLMTAMADYAAKSADARNKHQQAECRGEDPHKVEGKHAFECLKNGRNSGEYVDQADYASDLLVFAFCHGFIPSF